MAEEEEKCVKTLIEVEVIKTSSCNFGTCGFLDADIYRQDPIPSRSPATLANNQSRPPMSDTPKDADAEKLRGHARWVNTFRIGGPSHRGEDSSEGMYIDVDDEELDRLEIIERDLIAAAARFDAARAIPVRERLPEEAEEVLVWFNYSSDNFQDRGLGDQVGGVWRIRGSFTDADDEDDLRTITHWQPFPPNPAA